jgi:LCP family protein required for cell wall assembly
LAGGLLALLLIYLLVPLRTNVLLLGLDARPGEGDYGRSDTMILTTFVPLKPYVGMLSIPRDLWVRVPGHDENRINTAHYFGEIDHPGSGPKVAMQVVQLNFGVNVDYYARMQFSGFKDVVDALGGVEVSFPQDMYGFTQGTHHLNGDQALALVRDRTSGDDFGRMQRGQLFLKALWKQTIRPQSWPHLPQVVAALAQSIDTNLPFWLWPRLGLALLRAGPNGIDARTIDREMVQPFTTSGGAQVLAPDWQKINPMLMEMFGQ